MATFVKINAGTWKAIIRKQGWVISSETFRIKHDTTDWVRRTEDEMVRGVYISRASAECLTVKEALQRYLNEITWIKKPTTQRSEKITAEHLIVFLGRATRTTPVPRPLRLKRAGSTGHAKFTAPRLRFLSTNVILTS